MKIGSLFTGYRGLDMAVEAAFGANTVWWSDIDPGAKKINAHHWPDSPNIGDITKVDWAAVEPVDIITGGFPCQDLSHAGKRAGMRPGTRSGLWSHMAYAISQLRPRYVVAENVRGLLSACAHSDLEPCPGCVGDGPHGPVLRALGRVLADLAELGYDAQWRGIRASDVGAPHGRFRVFVVATRPAHRGLTTSHTPSDGRDEGRTEPAWQLGGLDAAERGDSPSTYANGSGARRDGRAVPSSVAEVGRQGFDIPTAVNGSATAVEWGVYESAIRRWESILGRTAPSPLVESRPLRTAGERRKPVGMRGRIYRHRNLSPAFPEWMMGLPLGHVTAVPGLTRNEQLKAIGNGVCPQQAYAAITHMLATEAAA